MRQRISTEQLGEISKEQRIKLAEWCLEKGYTDLTIGKCIEFLEDTGDYENEWQYILFDDPYGGGIIKKYNGELVDALWKAVKSRL